MKDPTIPSLPMAHRNECRFCVPINWVWMLPLFFGVATPFLAMPFCDGDINYYLAVDDPRSDHGDDYFWKRTGWLFPMSQSHAEWPQLGVNAESQILPIGIALNIAIGVAVWYCIWIIGWGISPNLMTPFTSKSDRTKRWT